MVEKLASKHIVTAAELAGLISSKASGVKVLDCTYYGDGKDPFVAHFESRIPG